MNVPVVATFAIAEPFIIPIKAEAITLTFAGPPGVRPTKVNAKSFINFENPECFKNEPNTTNKNI